MKRNQHKMNPTFITILACVFALLVIPQIFGSARAEDSKHATKGRLDLTGIDLGRSKVALDGEWEFAVGFHPGGRSLGTYANLPLAMKFGSHGYDPQGSVYGSGTYRLVIDLPRDYSSLALSLPYIGIASSLYINGTLVSQYGTPGLTRSQEVPGYRPQVVYTIPRGLPTLELVIQFSNWSDVIAGISYPLYLGDSQVIQSNRETSIIIDAVVFGALLLMGLYHFGFFVFRSKDLSPLFFGLLCLTIAIRTTFVNEIIILQVFPNLDWPSFMKIYYSATYLAPVVYLGFVQSVFPNKVGSWAFWIVLTLNALYIGLVWLSPVHIFTQPLQIMNLLLLAAGSFGFVSVLKAAFDKKEGTLMFIVGTGLFLIAAANDVLRIYYLIPTPNLVPWGTIAFLLAQALLLTRIFTRAYNLAENYSRHLLQINTSLERFIPREVLRFLKKESILDINLGDYSEEKMTVFFMDIRNFTALSETMAPKDNFAFINSFLNRFGPIVRENHGFIDKYVGDGIMALFPGSPRNAIEAARQMRKELKLFNDQRVAKGQLPIAIGIGIHHGPLMIGTIGENFRMDSTVISDTVNVASRLESLTKQHKVDILLSAATFAALEPHEQAGAAWLADETIRGKTKSMAIYTLLEFDQ